MSSVSFKFSSEKDRQENRRVSSQVEILYIAFKSFSKAIKLEHNHDNSKEH